MSQLRPCARSGCPGIVNKDTMKFCDPVCKAFDKQAGYVAERLLNPEKFDFASVQWAALGNLVEAMDAYALTISEARR